MKILSFFLILSLATIGRAAAQDDSYSSGITISGVQTGSSMGEGGGITVSQAPSGTLILDGSNYPSGLTLNPNLNQGTIVGNASNNGEPAASGDGYTFTGTINLVQGGNLDFAPAGGTLIFNSPTGYQFDSVFSSYYTLTSTSTANQFEVQLVPEPSTWLLLAVGALGLFGFARRRLARRAA